MTVNTHRHQGSSFMKVQRKMGHSGMLTEGLTSVPPQGGGVPRCTSLGTCDSALCGPTDVPWGVTLPDAGRDPSVR